MQIQSRVATVITLNQDEIDQAVIEFVKSRTTLGADAKFKVEYDDAVEGNDLTATVSVDAIVEQESEFDKFKAPVKPRGPRIVRNSEKTQPEPEAPAPLTSQQASEPDKVKPNDPPFDPDPPKTPAEPAAETVPPTTKIFTQTESSAPPTPAAEEPDPATKAKSLFANLAKPS